MLIFCLAKKFAAEQLDEIWPRSGAGQCAVPLYRCHPSVNYLLCVSRSNPSGDQYLIDGLRFDDHYVGHSLVKSHANLRPIGGGLQVPFFSGSLSRRLINNFPKVILYYDGHRVRYNQVMFSKPMLH